MVFPIFSLLSHIGLLSCACFPHSNARNLQFIPIESIAVYRTSPSSVALPLTSTFLPSRRTFLLCALRRPVTVENRRGRSGRREGPRLSGDPEGLSSW